MSKKLGLKPKIPKQRILFLTSHPMCVVSFILPHIRALKSDYDVSVMANTSNHLLLQKRGIEVLVEEVNLVRPISFVADLKILFVLYWRFLFGRFNAVHTITPKAGLLGMIAAWAARVPLRIHSFTGQVWVTQTGLMRWLLKTSDRVISAMATDVLVDSPSQRNFLIEQGVLTAERSIVLGAGSICGVSAKRFYPSEDVSKFFRNKVGTSLDAIVCLYLGRLNTDKGVLDLAQAFAKVAQNHPKAELWVVGPDEGDYFNQMHMLFGDSIYKVKRMGYTDTPEVFMQAANLLCLPSHREGFGSSVIEAAACGVPTLASRIYGLTDAVKEGSTGWMFRAGDVDDLAKKIDYLLANPAELSAVGEAARKYVETLFLEDMITSKMLEFYNQKLSKFSK